MNTPQDNAGDKTQRTDEQFVDHAKDLFADSVERMDAATLSKLNQQRQAAIAAAISGRTFGHWTRWMPATGVAAAALIAVLIMQTPATVDLPDVSDSAAADFEILLGDDSLEMIEELEFYSWIDIADLDNLDNVG